MRKIWIFNHYATNMFFDKGGRHHFFAKYLIQKGYDVTIFCASTIHNTDKNLKIVWGKYKEDQVDGIPYVFIKAPEYKGNGIKRVKNIVRFYLNLFPVTKEIAKRSGIPDVILASSVHPLTLLAGIQIGRKIGIPCVCEVRDLWPASIVEFGNISERNLIIQILYRLEKWLYQNADELIFTIAGGGQYIKDNGWDKSIDLQKVHYVNNGVDLESFDYNREHFQIQDEDLNNENLFKVVYAGSIRSANNIENLIKAMESLATHKCCLLLYGDGEDRLRLEEYCKKNELNNIKFKGKVEKKYIPFILSKADLNIINYKQTNLIKYGGSQNKLFEYFASGKPVCSNIQMGYSLIEEYHCGIEKKVSSSKDYAELIQKFLDMSREEYIHYSQNSRKVAEIHDYKVLTNKIEKILMNTER